MDGQKWLDSVQGRLGPDWRVTEVAGHETQELRVRW